MDICGPGCGQWQVSVNEIDGLTLDHYIDHVLHTIWAISIAQSLTGDPELWVI